MRQIKYTPLAIQDLDSSYDYISAENPYAAKTIIAKIELTISKLVEHPFLGHKGRVENTYEFVVLDTPFIIVYMVDDLYLKIVSILHSSRKFP